MISFTETEQKNNKLVSLLGKLLESCPRSSEDSKDFIAEMLKESISFTTEKLDTEPKHTGFGLKVELSRLQAILGEVTKEIVFYATPKKETLVNLIITLKILDRYSFTTKEEKL